MSNAMDKLILYQKFCDLIIYSFPIIGRFPQIYRFTLAQQIQNCMLDIVKLIVHANKLTTEKRTEMMILIDVELEKLKVLLRIAVELGPLSRQSYGVHCERIVEICKIFGGWSKTTKGA